MISGRGFKKKLEISILFQLEEGDLERVCIAQACSLQLTKGETYYVVGKLLATHYAKQCEMKDPIFASMFVS